ncbi:M4 family metallopeptidase [Streptomyces sp. NPDC050448]|uniref:M4 family metallopeptidase n=1 Tax=Streptomyces sp. NPDC050448 TaxID=3155404 RepID=UPI0034322291
MFDGRNDPDNPVLVREEGGAPQGDAAVDAAFDALGVAWDFFRSVYGRNSMDGRGGPVEAVVHTRDPGAARQGPRILLGDGDNGGSGPDGALAVEVVAARFMAGVIHHTAELESYGQPGALAISLGNVFGLLAKQYSRKETVQEADWLLGKGLLSSDGPAGSLKDPARFHQSSHMTDYDEASGDDGGVHTNAGIPNHAFYLVATELGGHAWEQAGRIWYKALMEYASRTTNFSAFRHATIGAARDLGLPTDVVAKAWSAVGVER